MRGRRDHIGDTHWIWVHASGHQPGHMAHVGEKIRAHLIGHFLIFVPFIRARIGAAASDNNFGFVLAGERAHLVYINVTIRTTAILDSVKISAGEI